MKNLFNRNSTKKSSRNHRSRGEAVNTENNMEHSDQDVSQDGKGAFKNENSLAEQNLLGRPPKRRISAEGNRFSQIGKA